MAREREKKAYARHVESMRKWLRSAESDSEEMDVGPEVSSSRAGGRIEFPKRKLTRPEDWATVKMEKRWLDKRIDFPPSPPNLRSLVEFLEE